MSLYTDVAKLACIVSGCLEPLQASNAVANPQTMASLKNDTLKMQARKTFSILATSTAESAMHIVSSVNDRSGFEAFANTVRDTSRLLARGAWRC